MADYHQHIKPIQRSKGRSAVAAAAYRSGKRMTDNRTGEIHDFTSKQGVSFQSIIGWLDTDEALWNAAEQAENRKDATTAREYEVSIPWELDEYEQRQLVTQYGFWLHEEYGVAVDINIHNATSHNPHAHILTTTRIVADELQLTDKSHREWSGSRRTQNGYPSRKTDINIARKKWATLCNTALKESGCDERIDHRSYVDRGILLPAQIHVGVHASAIHKKSIQTDRVKENEEIKVRQIKARRLLKEHDALIKKLNLLKLQFATQNSQSTLKINYYLHHFPLPENESTEIEFLDSWHHLVSKNNMQFGTDQHDNISDYQQEFSVFDDTAPAEYEEDCIPHNDDSNDCK